MFVHVILYASFCTYILWLVNNRVVSLLMAMKILAVYIKCLIMNNKKKITT